jgi:hypothetical protein
MFQNGIIFILFLIIILSLLVGSYKKKEFLEDDKNKSEPDDFRPKESISLNNYEQNCRKCCHKNKKREDCLKNCSNYIYKCLCC